MSVAQPTRMRGSGNTGWPAPGEREWRIWAMLAASVLGHILITTGPLLLGLAGLWAFDQPASDEPPVDAIPVDLLTDEPGPEPEPPPAPPPEPAAVALPPQPDAPKTAPEPAPVKPVAPPEDPADKPDKPVAPPGSLGDPVARAGLAGKAVDSNANVRILLHMSAVREHPLGTRIGGLLERTPQWSDFFGAAGVDPVRDVDHVLVAGPQLRDSSNVVAVVQHRLDQAAVTAAFERMVARGGEWIDHEPDIVKARADRAERLFVAPSSHIVAVVPSSAEKSARALSKNVRFPAATGGVALEAYVVTPSRVARGSGIKIPESLRWVRIEVSPEVGGGAIIRIEAEDGSPEQAAEDAPKLEKMIRAASTLDLGGGMLGGLASLAFGSSKQKFIEKIEFSSKEKMVLGSLLITKKQLATLLDLLDAVLPPARRVERFDPPAQSEPEKPTTTYPSNPMDKSGGSAPSGAPVGSDAPPVEPKGDPPSPDPLPAAPNPDP